MDKTKLTSVKVLTSLYHKFKVSTVNDSMTLQKLTNRALHLFLVDEHFRNDIETNSDLTISGSNF
jgi:lipopolysaccharide export system protein LptC|tara:strand:- start:2125 stop:2319 length:195 start_codon:yes stop_codon:yes gene_type:complete